MAFKLVAAPTFQCKVKIPVAGDGAPEEITFIFKHRTKEQLAEFFKGAGSDVDYAVKAVMDVATGWIGPVDENDKPAEFNEGNVAVLLSNYHAAFKAIAEAYMTGLGKYKLGN